MKRALRSAMAGLGFVLFIFSAAKADKVFYVSPSGVGSANGTSSANAANYLNNSFWGTVQSTLATQPVTVQFINGTYSGDTLNLTYIGNAANKLTLTGNATGSGAVFNSTYAWNIRLRGDQNIAFQNLHFTGQTQSFALHMQSEDTTPTHNIVVQNCTFEDLPDAAYGAMGITLNTYNVTVQNCTFERVGNGAGAHMIYTDHGPYNIEVLNNTFVDDPGDYVRFRDNVGTFEVIGNTFQSTQPGNNRAFVSMPLFNDTNPGTEIFATNMVVKDNTFQYNPTYPSGVTPFSSSWYGQPISFVNFGFNYPGYTYQLTPAEAQALQTGTAAQRVALLKQLTGIDLSKVFVGENNFTNLGGYQVSYASFPNYGSPSSGWQGYIDLTSLVQSVPEPAGAAICLVTALFLQRRRGPQLSPS